MSNILTVCKMFCPMFCLTSLKKKDWEMCSPACEAHRKRKTIIIFFQAVVSRGRKMLSAAFQGLSFARGMSQAEHDASNHVQVQHELYADGVEE